MSVIEKEHQGALDKERAEAEEATELIVEKERQGTLDKERADAEEATELIVGVSELATKKEHQGALDKERADAEEATELIVGVSELATKKERQGALDKERADAEEATELIVGVSELAKREESNVSTSKQNIATNTSPTSKQPGSATDKSMEEYKKRLKGRAVFTVTGSNLIQARHFDVVYDRWEKTTNPVSTLDNDLTASTTETPSATDIGYLDFFEDDKAMRRLLMVEESRLTENKHYMLAQTSMLWRGDISQMIQEAIAKKKLSDWLVSMAPLAGFEVWEEACVAFAKQLEECGEVLKASSYLLAIHNVHEAVRLLADHKMFKEAVAVAKCRLSHDDSLTSKVYTEWGDMSRAQGNLTLAVHCYWAACNFQLCIETLVRIKELKYLKMAAVIAKFHNYTELANSLALECLLMSISASNPTVGYHILEQFPNEECCRSNSSWDAYRPSPKLVVQIKMIMLYIGIPNW
ncbi:Gem-associated protein 5 [Homalodisca vitripennis]|nr:Gem-associated protein 5 [Homalodisca vitripennis]